MVRAGKSHKEIYVTPSGFQNGFPEEVLIIVEGVHAPIPSGAAGNQPVYLLAPPTGEGEAPTPTPPSKNSLTTDADRLLDRYRKIGEAQNHVYGERGNGAPNYNATDDSGAHRAPEGVPPENASPPTPQR